MKDTEDLLGIVQAALGTFENRQSFSPGMFEPLKPLFTDLGFESFAVYIADDYPDRMQLVCSAGGDDRYPTYVVRNGRNSLHRELDKLVAEVPGIMTARLFSHGRELGAVAAVTRKNAARRLKPVFDVLAQSLSIMAYVERIRTNDRRERQERDIFFAQSLTNRLLIRETPKIKNLRLGFEFNRALEAGGDFFDLMPSATGGVIGFIGSCNGRGVRTVLEVATIMREAHRSCPAAGSLSEVLLKVNDLLVRQSARAHQASMCVFEVDTANLTLRIAKAGKMGLLLCGPGGRINNITANAPGGLFLGMVSKPKICDEVYEFRRGQALLCVTEGLYSSRNFMNVQPQLHWFVRAVEATLESKSKIPLAKAVFANLAKAADFATRTEDSMLALSVEFTGASAMSGRVSQRLARNMQ